MKIFIFLIMLICSLFCLSVYSSPTYTVTYHISTTLVCGIASTSLTLVPNTVSVGVCMQIYLAGAPTGTSAQLVSAPGGVLFKTYSTTTCAGVSVSVTSTVVDGITTTCTSFGVDADDIKIVQNSAGGMGGDPHFTPISENKTISKMKYTPTPKEDGVYNIFSNKRIQWNSYFKTYQGLYDIIHLTRQFVTTEYFIIRSPLKNGENVMISFKVVTDKTKSKYPFLQPTINQLVSSKEVKEGKGQVKTMRKFTKSQSPIPFKMSNRNKIFFIFGEQHPQYFIRTPNLYNVVLETPFMRIKSRLTFFDFANKGYLSKKHKRELGAKYNKFDFPYFDSKVDVIETKGMEDSHGILGQTMRPECPYKEPHNECVQCFMKGEPKDYRIEKDKPFGTNFKFNKFK